MEALFGNAGGPMSVNVLGERFVRTTVKQAMPGAIFLMTSLEAKRIDGERMA
jgi:hypothetical protein